MDDHVTKVMYVTTDDEPEHFLVWDLARYMGFYPEVAVWCHGYYDHGLTRDGREEIGNRWHESTEVVEGVCSACEALEAGDDDD